MIFQHLRKIENKQLLEKIKHYDEILLMWKSYSEDLENELNRNLFVDFSPIKFDKSLNQVTKIESIEFEKKQLDFKEIEINQEIEKLKDQNKTEENSQIIDAILNTISSIRETILNNSANNLSQNDLHFSPRRQSPSKSNFINHFSPLSSLNKIPLQSPNSVEKLDSPNKTISNSRKNLSPNPKKEQDIKPTNREISPIKNRTRDFSPNKMIPTFRNLSPIKKERKNCPNKENKNKKSLSKENFDSKAKSFQQTFHSKSKPLSPKNIINIPKSPSKKDYPIATLNTKKDFENKVINKV
jgi:hypothetical protein